MGARQPASSHPPLPRGDSFFTGAGAAPGAHFPPTNVLSRPVDTTVAIQLPRWQVDVNIQTFRYHFIPEDLLLLFSFI